MPRRTGLPAELAGLLGVWRPDRVLRVAVDGPDTAGKTTLADAVAAQLALSGPILPDLTQKTAPATKKAGSWRHRTRPPAVLTAG